MITVLCDFFEQIYFEFYDFSKISGIVIKLYKPFHLTFDVSYSYILYLLLHKVKRKKNKLKKRYKHKFLSIIVLSDDSK